MIAQYSDWAEATSGTLTVSLTPSKIQDPGSYNQTLNFACAFVDLGDAGIAVHPLNWIFTAVAVAPMDLNCFVSDPSSHLACKQLCNGSFHREALAGVLLPRGFSRE